MSVLLSTSLHHHLSQVSAQEANAANGNLIYPETVSTEIVSNNTESNAEEIIPQSSETKLISEETISHNETELSKLDQTESDGSDLAESEQTGPDEASEENLSNLDANNTEAISVTQSSEAGKTSNEDVSQEINLEDVQRELANAVIFKVNQLRQLNGLDPLEVNPQLQVAADTLVEKQPISKEFIDTYGSSHRLDTQIAQESGYHSNFIPANHLFAEYSLEDLKASNLLQLASDFVNKWYLDLATPDLAHRKQMLTRQWVDTAVGVKIIPKIMLGEYKNEFVTSKFGDVVYEKNKFNLIHGFEIHLTQFFGNSVPQNSYTAVNDSLSLATYLDYIQAHIGEEELNPNTGSYEKLTNFKASNEINRQKRINQLNQDKYSAISDADFDLDGNYSEEELWQELLANQKIYDNQVVYQDLKDKIIDKILTHQKKDQLQVLEVFMNDQSQGQWRVSRTNTGYDLMSLNADYLQPSIQDEQFSRQTANIFADRNAAISYGKYVILKHPDYYFSLAEMNDGQFSVWFSKKMTLREDTWAAIENSYLTEEEARNLIYDLEQMYEGFVAEAVLRNKDELYDWLIERNILYTIKISPETPFIKIGDNFKPNEYKSGLFWIGKAGGEEIREEIDLILRKDIEMVNIPWDSKYLHQNVFINGLIPFYKYPGDQLYLLPSFKTENEAREAGQKGLQAGQTLHIYEDRHNQFVYYYLPDNFEQNHFTNMKDLMDYYQTLPDNLLYQIGIDESNNYKIYFSGIKTEEDQNLATRSRTNVYVFEDLDQLHQDISRYIDRKDQRYDIYKIGDLYAVTFQALEINASDGERAFNSLESAKEAAKKYVQAHPNFYYDIFKVDDVYVIKYGENRLETRWTPDGMFFNTQVDAQTMAKHVESLVKLYEYEIVPDHLGFYRIRTNKIVYFDDQDGLLLVPEYNSSGNSGLLGQDAPMTLETLTNIYKLKGLDNLWYNENLPDRSQPDIDLPNENPWPDIDYPTDQPIAQPDWNLPVQPENPNINKDLLTPPTVYAEDQNTALRTGSNLQYFAQINQNGLGQKLDFNQRIRLKVNDAFLQEIVNYLLQFMQDLSSPNLLFYQIDFIFTQPNQVDLSQPVTVEMVLLQGEEVEQVQQWDRNNQLVNDEIPFRIEERKVSDIEKDFPNWAEAVEGQETVKVLVFEITSAGNYSIQLSDQL